MSEPIFVLAGTARKVFRIWRLYIEFNGEKTLKDLVERKEKE